MKLLYRISLIVCLLTLGGQLFAQRTYDAGNRLTNPQQIYSYKKTYDDKVVTFNIRGGFNGSEMSGVNNSNYSFGGRGGFGVDFKLASSPIYIQSGVDFVMKGVEGRQSSQINVNYLQAPLHLAYKPEIAEGSKFVVFAGGYFGYGVYGNMIFDVHAPNDVEAFGDDRFKKLDCGLSFGVGFEVARLILTTGAEVGMNNISDLNVSSSKLESYFWGKNCMNRSFYFTVGYKF
mgnify:CR=1 FL=1